MNKENLDRLIRHLENDVDDEHFTMNIWGTWSHDCGTVACIGGHCLTLALNDRFHELKSLPPTKRYWFSDHLCCSSKFLEVIGDFLDLSIVKVGELCHPLGLPDTPDTRFTREQALCTLRVLRETGEVDWDNSQKRWAEIAKAKNQTEPYTNPS